MINSNFSGCEKCRSGYIISEDGKITFCDCYLEEIFKTKCKNAGIPEIYFKFAQVDNNLIDFCALKNYNKTDDYFKGIFLSDFINKYVNNIEKLFSEGWNLIIEGPIGSLKTTISCILGKEAIKRGYSVQFTEMQRLRKLWTGEKLTSSLLDFKEKIDFFDFLILDDFGNEYIPSFSEYYLTQLFLLFRERLYNNKVFIINSNLSPKKLQKKYSQQIISLFFEKTIHLKISSKKDFSLHDDIPDYIF